jgi:hypothetical protein
VPPHAAAHPPHHPAARLPQPPRRPPGDGAGPAGALDRGELRAVQRGVELPAVRGRLRGAGGIGKHSAASRKHSRPLARARGGPAAPACSIRVRARLPAPHPPRPRNSVKRAVATSTSFGGLPTSMDYHMTKKDEEVGALEVGLRKCETQAADRRSEAAGGPGRGCRRPRAPAFTKQTSPPKPPTTPETPTHPTPKGRGRQLHPREVHPRRAPRGRRARRARRRDAAQGVQPRGRRRQRRR